MKPIFLFFTTLLLPLFLFCQKNDHVWLLGGGKYPDSLNKSCSMTFSQDTFELSYIPKNFAYDGANCILSDTSGNFMCFSNGYSIFNKDGAKFANGHSFFEPGDSTSGWPTQGFFMLPLPGSNNKFVFIYAYPEILDLPQGLTQGYTKILYAIGDATANNGKGVIIDRDIVAGEDSTTFLHFNACRHSNGRDWWLLFEQYEDLLPGEKFYRYLLDPTGLHRVGEQIVPITPAGIGQTCFSPDGKWMARYNLWGFVPTPNFSTIDLYPFDRCTGEVGDRISKTWPMPGEFGGTAFSNSGHYLYVARTDSIHQYDMLAPDIFGSEKLVAEYDGFTDASGSPELFYMMQLAPDKKIYIASSLFKFSRYLHVIENPEEEGVACNVRQHHIQLPVYNNYGLPNLPYYRLGKEVGSSCDTIVDLHEVVNAELHSMMHISPNPASSEFDVVIEEATCYSVSSIRLYNQIGLLVDQFKPNEACRFKIPCENLVSGVYFLKLSLGRGEGFVRKLVVAKN